MSDREECLRVLTDFIRSGDIGQGAPPPEMILAYLNPLENSERLEALEALRETLASDLKAGVSGSAEERHVAVEDALDQACRTVATQADPS
jgi:hypothetical protein